MEPAPATSPPPLVIDRLRWLDLVPVLVFTILGLVFVFAILFGIARMNRAFDQANAETISLLATLAVYLAVAAGIAVGLRRLHSPLKYLQVRWPRLEDLGLAALLLVPWYAGVYAISSLAAFIFNGGHTIPSNSRLVFIQRPQGVGLLLLALIVTAVAAPICEELFFRGMLFRLLEERTFVWVAVLISAVAFGLAHAGPAVSLALLPTFIYMGAVLALVYVRTGWLTNSMLLHAMNNGLVTILAFSYAAH